MTPYTVGQLVMHPKKPEWGPGKVVRVERERVHVLWRDLPERAAKCIVTSHVKLDPAPNQHDDILDNLPPLVEKDGKLLLPKERVTLKMAADSFLARFPQGFADPLYKEYERDYKWAAHEYYVESLGGDQLAHLLADDLPEAVRRVERCMGKVNLLASFEQAAFRDALKDEQAARAYLTQLESLLRADDVTEDSITPYFKAVTNLPAERGRVATWPIATIVPFLARPDLHMFLKPTVTQDAANRLAFHLNYRSEPNWLTYHSLVKMADLYAAKLAALAPRDRIDVQSFFWAACGGYDQFE